MKSSTQVLGVSLSYCSETSTFHCYHGMSNNQLPTLEPLKFHSIFTAENNLTQSNLVLNGLGTVLDLVFSSESCQVSNALDPIIPNKVRHPAFGVSLVMPVVNTHSATRPQIMNFRRCDVEAVRVLIWWCFLELHISISITEQFFNNFITNVQEVVVKHTPTKPAVKRRFPHWFSPELRKLVVENKRLNKLYISRIRGHL